jgi:hypothetical protein
VGSRARGGDELTGVTSGGGSSELSGRRSAVSRCGRRWSSAIGPWHDDAKVAPQERRPHTTLQCSVLEHSDPAPVMSHCSHGRLAGNVWLMAQSPCGGPGAAVASNILLLPFFSSHVPAGYLVATSCLPFFLLVCCAAARCSLLAAPQPLPLFPCHAFPLASNPNTSRCVDIAELCSRVLTLPPDPTLHHHRHRHRRPYRKQPHVIVRGCSSLHRIIRFAHLRSHESRQHPPPPMTMA